MADTSSLADTLYDDITEIVNASDNTKRLVFDLSTAVTGATLTLQAEHTVDRTITFPDRDGTVCVCPGIRTELCCEELNFEEAPEILYQTLSSSYTMSIINPVLGKTVVLEIVPAGFTLSFPSSYCYNLSGRFDTTQTNYIYIQCIKAGVDPIYLVSFAQRIA